MKQLRIPYPIKTTIIPKGTYVRCHRCLEMFLRIEADLGEHQNFREGDLAYLPDFELVQGYHSKQCRWCSNPFGELSFEIHKLDDIRFVYTMNR